MIEVYLPPKDRELALDVGKRRWESSKKKRSKARFVGAKEVDHIDGAGGELAFCRALGLEWPGHVDVYKIPDVPPLWEVRTLRRMRGVSVHPEDPDDWLVAWVAGEMPTFTVMGYIVAGGAKRHPEWYQDPKNQQRPIYLVPPSKMVPIWPDFHRTHQYSPKLDWRCVICGAESE